MLAAAVVEKDCKAESHRILGYHKLTGPLSSQLTSYLLTYLINYFKIYT